MPKEKAEVLHVSGREVSITNPSKIYFPKAGVTKLELAQYYLAVAEGAVRGVRGRPMALKRFVNGVEKEPFFQKRAPESRPDWIETIELKFPSGRTASEIVVRSAAELLWVVNLGCVDLNPHPVRADDLDHPDELRVDLDPIPGIEWDQIRKVALLTREVLEEHKLAGFPKTSGSRGIHINVRIEPRWGFDEVRRAALALAREVERRSNGLATSKWWKEERQGVFLDYNQNAKDRTVASAYSVRPTADARVSTPLTWNEVPDCDPADFTLRTVPARFATIDPDASIDDAPGSLESLLELSDRQRGEGQGDAPWPPMYRKQSNEPPRVQPSRRRAEGPWPKRVRVEGELPKPTGRRTSTMPLLVISKSPSKEAALEGLERWKAKHPSAAEKLEPSDVLVDAMRGRFTAWYRVRVNLRHVPEGERPEQAQPDPDDEPSFLK